ncbi:hypothetical protein GGR02_002112 [Anoxybacillus voinovskiensis]|uniref:Transposase putative helix-turn-helix domain-containing protein n=1 Tax=Anoxybacteroides voinovskiense TaxID=230470 RepID=A0A840DZD5_9BACL|nr:hypothetical protein [Anoxybacillus voinovskiensis]GGJ69260.1 hypothetical protein GCM10008982_18340 [Anoxybacillus voinovskiensis]
MDMTLTAKIKIYPTAEQAEVLKATLSAYRQACNAVSVVIFDTKVLAQAKLHDMTIVHFEQTTRCVRKWRNL